jgi:osmoprotectant transport system ATP-binding protein
MIKFSSVTKRFEGSPAPVVDNISFEVGEGEICVLLGASGCGKTTTLKMINRLVEPTSGKIYLEGRDTDGFDAVQLRRQIGYVIQQIGLFPNMTVEENICAVPKLLGWDKSKSRRRAAELLEMMALDPSVYLGRYPKDLSGGQAQRVGVARALATDPPVMLMDEPFGAVDPINRELIQDEFLRIHGQVRKTVMFVSHDIDEAIKMADRIAIFRDGRIEQFDTPDNILARPATQFVASFVGADRALKRLRLMRVGEALSARHCSVRLGEAGARAAAMLEQHGLDRIVLLDDSDKPVGYLTSGQLRDVEGALSSRHALPVAQSARTSDDLRSVVSMMFSCGASSIPATDDDGRFVGYVSQAHILKILELPVEALA